MWFRRLAWNQMQPGVKPPAWHILDETTVRTEKEISRGTVVALCGYRRDQVLDGVSWKEEIRTKKLQCSKCVKKQASKTSTSGE